MYRSHSGGCVKGKKQAEGLRATREAMMLEYVLGIRKLILNHSMFVMLNDSSTVHRIDNVGARRHHRLLHHWQHSNTFRRLFPNPFVPFYTCISPVDSQIFHICRTPMSSRGVAQSFSLCSSCCLFAFCEPRDLLDADPFPFSIPCHCLRTLKVDSLFHCLVVVVCPATL
jgi:hypothetical protein